MESAICPTFPDVAKHVSRRGIGWAIRRVRKAQHRTLTEVATEIGSDAANLSRVERGEQEVTEGALWAIAEVLNVSVSDLWRLAESGEQSPDDSGRVLALTGLMSPEQRERLLDFGRYLVDRKAD